MIDQILSSAVYINNKAVCLYKKLGFYQYGIIENYFKLGDRSWPQIFMVLTRETYLFNTPGKKLYDPSLDLFDKFI